MKNKIYSKIEVSPKSYFCILVALIFLALPSHVIASKKSKFQIPDSIEYNKPTENKTYSIAVIGGGVAGTMAVNKSISHNDEVLFVVGERKTYQQARGMWVPEFANIPALKGVKDPVVTIRNSVIQSIVKSPQSNKLAVLESSIDNLSRENKNGNGVFKLTDSQGKSYFAQYVILATGMMDTQPIIGGSIKPIFPFANTQQVIYCLRCDGHFAQEKKNVAVIGYTNQAVSSALVLKERYPLSKVVILTNGHSLVEVNSDIKRQLNLLKIVVNEKTITSLSDKKSKILKTATFQDGSIQDVDLILVSLGVRINNALAKEVGAELNSEGYVIVDKDGQTSVKNLFAAGDIVSNSRKQVYTAWDSAIKASEAINQQLRLIKRPLLN